MRNKLSYDLFRSFSENNYAPNIEYVLVYLNDEFWGIYALTERVDKNRLNLNKNDTNSVIFKDAPISCSPDKHEKNYKDFIEFSNWAEFYKNFSDRAFEKLLSEVYYNQRYPNIYDGEQNKKQLIFDVTEFIFNSPDHSFLNDSVFSLYFDIDNIIDWHLLLLISNNSDGKLKNFYLYRRDGKSPYIFCPWDYDHSFGRDGGGELDQNSFIDVSNVKLLDRLIETNAFNYRKKLYNKFLLLKKKKILRHRSINKMIDNNIALLEPFIDQHEKRWPPQAIDYFKNSDFSKEILLMEGWIKLRLDKVEEYLISLNGN